MHLCPVCGRWVGVATYRSRLLRFRMRILDRQPSEHYPVLERGINSYQPLMPKFSPHVSINRLSFAGSAGISSQILSRASPAPEWPVVLYGTVKVESLQAFDQKRANAAFIATLASNTLGGVS